MAYWRSVFTYDPVDALLSSGNNAVAFFAERDLIGNNNIKTESLWNLPDAQKIVRKQQENGSWKYPGGKKEIRSTCIKSV